MRRQWFVKVAQKASEIFSIFQQPLQQNQACGTMSPWHLQGSSGPRCTHRSWEAQVLQVVCRANCTDLCALSCVVSVAPADSQSPRRWRCGVVTEKTVGDRSKVCACAAQTQLPQVLSVTGGRTHRRGTHGSRGL